MQLADKHEGTTTKAFAGLRNDPFFFDAEGYNGMVAAFDGPAPAGGYLVNAFGLGSRARRDSFANRNVSAIVFMAPLGLATGAAVVLNSEVQQSAGDFYKSGAVRL